MKPPVIVRRLSLPTSGDISTCTLRQWSRLCEYLEQLQCIMLVLPSRWFDWGTCRGDKNQKRGDYNYCDVYQEKRNEVVYAYTAGIMQFEDEFVEGVSI